MIIAKPVFPDFGEWLTYAEGVKSAEAIRRGILNVPTLEQYNNMVKAYTGLYVPICRQFGKLPITSFFRSAKLNVAVKGSKTSAHMDGLAIDIDCDGLKHVSNDVLYKWIRQNRWTLGYDQVITEFPDAAGKPSWIHVAYRATGNQRRQGMRAEKRPGQVIYIYE